MNAEQRLNEYVRNGTISPELEASMEEPSSRLEIYSHIIRNDVVEYRELLLYALKKEVQFRNALWEGKVEDAEDYFENIYHCIFLLSCCANPADIFELWEVQYLNQDIGELDVGSFVGAGVTETLDYLDQLNNEKADEIASYIRSHFEDSSALKWVESWREGRREYLLNL